MRSEQNLTVRDGKVQIKTVRTPTESIRVVPRTAIETGENKQSSQKLMPSPNRRYVVKEEQSHQSPSQYSRHSNEDLICFSRELQV